MVQNLPSNLRDCLEKLAAEKVAPSLVKTSASDVFFLRRAGFGTLRSFQYAASLGFELEPLGCKRVLVILQAVVFCVAVN